jgi:23S rRNA pseudouridine955/2504/2580 synthase
LTVAEDEGEQRLDRWFKRRFPQLTQARSRRCAAPGRCASTAGGPRRPTGGPRHEDRVPPLPEGEAPKAEARRRRSDAEMIQAPVLWKDEHMIVLNKPAGPAVAGRQRGRATGMSTVWPRR